MQKLFVIIFSFLIVSCSCSKTEEKTQPQEVREVFIEDSVHDLCREKISEVLKESSVQKSTIDLLPLYYQAKSDPVWFVEEPKYTETDSKLIKAHRSRFDKANPWTFLVSETNKKYYKWKPEIGREVFLRNGYFYHPDPLTAHAMAQLVNLDMVVKGNEFLIQRGRLLMAVERKNKNFFFKDGPYTGRIATLAFLDRVIEPEGGVNGIVPPSLHIDFTLAKDEQMFDTIAPKFVSEHHVVADLHYGNKTVKTLFNREDIGIRFECEVSDTTKIKDERSDRTKGIVLLKKAMLAQVLERVPFDEPKYETDQEDGNLRDAWMRSFYMGRLKYQYKNARMVEENHIYDHLGKPIPPQVCIDFLVDTLDRAAGSWYTPVNERRRPSKTEGSFNSANLRYKDDEREEQRYTIRNISGFTRFARDYPNWFEVIDISDGVKIGSSEFFDYMPTLDLQEGDMVFVKGPVPWDKKEEHSHSFIIYQTDPVTGMPILLAGNAGTASLRPWKIETNRTPNRSIIRIVRLKNEFLKVISGN